MRPIGRRRRRMQQRIDRGFFPRRCRLRKIPAVCVGVYVCVCVTRGWRADASAWYALIVFGVYGLTSFPSSVGCRSSSDARGHPTSPPTPGELTVGTVARQQLPAVGSGGPQSSCQLRLQLQSPLLGILSTLGLTAQPPQALLPPPPRRRHAASACGHQAPFRRASPHANSLPPCGAATGP